MATQNPLLALKKIIIVSPIIMYPVNNGGARRILDLISFFKKKDYSIGLIAYDFNGHRDFLINKVDFLWLFEGKKPRVDYKSFLQRQKDRSFNDFAISIIMEQMPGVVISIFAWTSDILYRLPKGILTFLDTIDIQHMRTINARKAGGELSDRYCSREEETTELYKADILIAIQKKEKQLIEEMCPGKKVILVEYAPQNLKKIKTSGESKKILFVGNLYDPNIRGIKLFMDNCWQQVKNNIPQAELFICGEVCKAIEDYKTLNGVKLLYYVDDLLEYYRETAIVLNVSLYGTGLPIKTVEALSMGKCLVCTEVAVSSLDDDIEKIPAVISGYADMAEKIIFLLENPGKRIKIENKAYNYSKNRFIQEKIYSQLLGIIEQHVNLLPRIESPLYIINSDFELWTYENLDDWIVGGEAVSKAEIPEDPQAKVRLQLASPDEIICIFQCFKLTNLKGVFLHAQLTAKCSEPHRLFFVIAIRADKKWIKVARSEHPGNGEWEELTASIEIPREIRDPNAEIKVECRLEKGARQAAFLSKVKNQVLPPGYFSAFNDALSKDNGIITHKHNIFKLRKVFTFLKKRALKLRNYFRR